MTAILALYFICKPVVDYFLDPYDLRRFPAPSYAGFSSLWSAVQSRKLRRSRAIFDAHQRLGPIVRIQPTHVSFLVPDAVADIYGHGTVFEKDFFYNTLSSDDHESIVGTRNREEHARKRRYISSVFSQRNVVSMEPLVADKVRKIVDRLDRACGSDEIIDIRCWLNLFTVDVISDMAFGRSLGLLDQGHDKTEAESMGGKRYKMNLISSFQQNTVHVASLGHWPALLSYTRFLTHWFPNNTRGQDFTDMCTRNIRRRLRQGDNVSKPEFPHGDFFQHLLVDKDGKPRNLPFGELVQEAGVMMSAGSDTSASAMTNTLYLLLKNATVLEKLRAELDRALSASSDDVSKMTAVGVAPYESIKNLPYLRACLDEGLRSLPPTSIGLLRVTPPQGAVVAGQFLKGGITCSSPTFSLHHDPKLFPDPWSYKPERWLDGSDEERRNLKSYVIPFTLGRHACIGRNIAFIEQYIVLATLVSHYEFAFATKDFVLAVKERINANPGEMPVRVRRRGGSPNLCCDDDERSVFSNNCGRKKSKEAELIR